MRLTRGCAEEAGAAHGFRQAGLLDAVGEIVLAGKGVIYEVSRTPKSIQLRNIQTSALIQ